MDENVQDGVLRDFRNVLRVLTELCPRIQIHVYCSPSILEDEHFFKRLKNVHHHELLSLAGKGILLNEEMLNESLKNDQGNVVILADIDNMECKKDYMSKGGLLLTTK